MEKDFVTYSAAALAAKRGGVGLSASEYNGFADIGTGGLLREDGNECAGLRLLDDTDGSLDGYIPMVTENIIRREPVSSACLKRRDDGVLVIKQNNSREDSEENNDK
jgi:hypothetical protein